MTEQIDEISKELAGRYVVKAAADMANQNKKNREANVKWSKASDSRMRVKAAGPDKDYGETDSEHAERINRLTKRIASGKADSDTAMRKGMNRLGGIHKAGKILAKEEVEVNENLENILVYAWNKDAVNLRDALDAEMQSRIEDHVQSMVTDVSARLFNPALATSTNEDHEG